MKTGDKQNGRAAVYQWLRDAAARRNLRLELFPKWATQDGNVLAIPADLPEVSRVHEWASRLQDLEDSWNNRKPKPSILVFLVPSAAPSLD